MTRNHNAALLILRLSIGVLMLLHGIDKIFHGIDSIVDMMKEIGMPGSFAYGVYIGEVLAPLLLIIGFRARIAAMLLVMNMLVIIFIAHPGQIFELNQHGAWALELPGLYLSGTLAVIFTGGGRYAISSKNRWD